MNDLKWIACTSIMDEWCKHYPPALVQKGETIKEAKRRVLQPEWKSIGAALVDYTPTDEDIDEVLSDWVVLVFSDLDDVRQLRSITPPDYNDLQFAVSETLDAVYRAFADEILTP